MRSNSLIFEKNGYRDAYMNDQSFTLMGSAIRCECRSMRVRVKDNARMWKRSKGNACNGEEIER